MLDTSFFVAGLLVTAEVLDMPSSSELGMVTHQQQVPQPGCRQLHPLQASPHVATLACVVVVQVMSRSGDECVVALTDQWYLTYGEEQWQRITMEALEQLETYSDEAKNSFRHCLGEREGEGQAEEGGVSGPRDGGELQALPG
jgi:hypothetical protein